MNLMHVLTRRYFRMVWRPLWKLTRWIGPAMYDTFADDVGEDYQTMVAGLVIAEVVLIGFGVYAGSLASGHWMLFIASVHYGLGGVYYLNERQWGNPTLW